jgi:hypothetical protein
MTFLFKIVAQGVSLWYFHLYMCYNLWQLLVHSWLKVQWLIGWDLTTLYMSIHSLDNSLHSITVYSFMCVEAALDQI